jgi:hypothetical protein
MFENQEWHAGELIYSRFLATCSLIEKCDLAHDQRNTLFHIALRIDVAKERPEFIKSLGHHFGENVRNPKK